MELFEAIKQRHSYRETFGAQEPSKQQLRQIVEAGLAAPSGCNAQTTEFVIIDDASLVKKIAELNPTNKAMQTAKAFILCIVDKNPQPTYGELSFAVEDCAAAVENILLAIAALGYASVWIDGWLRVDGRAEKIGGMISLPQSKVLRILLPIGSPTVQVQRREKKPFEQRAFWNKYR